MILENRSFSKNCPLHRFDSWILGHVDLLFEDLMGMGRARVNVRSIFLTLVISGKEIYMYTCD